MNNEYGPGEMERGMNRPCALNGVQTPLSCSKR